MKVLQVNCFHNWGSTGKITYAIHTGLLDRGVESQICYGRGAKTEEEGITKICPEWYSKFNNLRSRITGIMYGGFCYSTSKLIQIIQREKPDVVHLQCINCFFVNIYQLVEWLKTNHVKTVLTLHAEFMYTANCGYALDCEKWRTGCGDCPRWRKETRSWFVDRTHQSFVKMQDAFRGFEKDLTVISVSPWLRDRALQSPILKNMRHEVILNGLNTDVFQPWNSYDLRKMHHVEGKRVLFHATSSFSDDPDHLKGGWYVLELAKRMKDLPMVFMVAGKYHLSGPVPDNLVLLGNISDQKLLARYYSMADATLLTSKKETFSMVCAESLCCGTPVFGFKAGAPEMIALKDYSLFVDNGDIDCLEKSVIDYLNGKAYERTEVAEQACNVYSRDVMLEQYIELYRQLCQ